MAQTVKVRLRKPGRVFTFVSRDIPLRRNDSCVLRTDRGLEYGLCVLPSEECTREDEARFKMTVVRKATHHDDMTFRQVGIDEDRAKDLCRTKIKDRDLPMKLVECEYSFDRKKIIFYFTAEDRVDFRELVRDLAQELKARIELRHIQVRDEAKIVGGIGTCGRELCCTTWMREFVPISMKMAKRQNLSLNPSKISGQCGRLMCCLSYENDQYARAKKAKAERAATPDPAAIRDEMEAQPEETLEVLRVSSLRDVLEVDPHRLEDEDVAPEKAQTVEKPRELDEAVPEHTPAQGVAATQESDSEESASESPAASAVKPRRRRRRKKRRGGPKKGDQQS